MGSIEYTFNLTWRGRHLDTVTVEADDYEGAVNRLTEVIDDCLASSLEVIELDESGE